MKILPDVTAAPLDLRMTATSSETSFEASLDLAATLRIRQTQSRAFSFAERGVLSPSDLQAPFSGGPDAAAGALPQMATAQSLPSEVPSEAETESPTAPRFAAPAGLGHLASARTIAGTTAPIAETGTTGNSAVAAAGSTPIRASRGSEPGSITGRSVSVRQPASAGSGSAAANDIALAVHRAVEGIVVVAAAGELSPVALAQLRARAQALASDLGERLIEFRLNGALIAPQSLFGRT